jgi:hypothetical protein
VPISHYVGRHRSDKQDEHRKEKNNVHGSRERERGRERRGGFTTKASQFYGTVGISSTRNGECHDFSIMCIVVYRYPRQRFPTEKSHVSMELQTNNYGHPMPDPL